MKNNKNISVSPVGLKGKEVSDRMKELMGITSINENKSNSVVELTKIGPDGKAYAIIRENHKYFIKVTDKKSGLLAEDFKYIGGLQNKQSEAYGSYANAIKHLNLNFKSLAEAYGTGGDINAFKNDNLLSEAGIAGFSTQNGNGFSGQGNMEGNTSLYEEEEAKNNPWAICTASVGREDKAKFEACVADVKKEKGITEGYDDEPYYDDVKGKSSNRWDSDDADEDESDDAEDMSEAELAIDAVLKENTGKKLSIVFAMENMDAIIESMEEVKKKVE